MKKLTALLLSLAMVFSLAACGNTANTPADTSKDDAQTPAVSPVEKPDDTNTPDDAETPDDANTPAAVSYTHLHLCQGAGGRKAGAGKSC